MDERLRRVPLFADLAEDDLARICTDVAERHLDVGEVLFREGDAGDAAYVVVDGEVEIVKATGGRDAIVAVRGRDEVIGEAALLRASPRAATVRARTAVELLRIPRSGLEALLETSSAAARTLFGTLLDRMEETTERLRHTERMAQLGTLTAGVAHELNNPAAAVLRSADQLAGALDDLTALLDELDRPGPVLSASRALRGGDTAPPSDPVARSDAESALDQWLAARGVADSWVLADGLVQSGVKADDVAAATGRLSAGDAAAAARLAVAMASSRRLAAEVVEGARRLSTLVGALRSFSHLDRAPVADIDVHRGLDDTLTVLGHIARQVRVVRDYDPDLPRITALGAELNQVWTNLVDNAVAALTTAGTPDPTVTVRTRRSDGDVVVEVEDNGPGIPPEARDRVFDAFYTTKPPGAGTGLGLHLSQRIVVLEHGGSLDVESKAGRTVFRVTLPTAGQNT